MLYPPCTSYSLYLNPPSPWTNLTLEHYNDIEEQCDKRNSWNVSREVTRRVDGAEGNDSY